MKNTFRRIVSLALALVMAMSLAVSASAAEVTFDLLTEYGNAPTTVSSAVIQKLDTYTNVLNYGSVETYSCTAPVTITSDAKNNCRLLELDTNVASHMPCLFTGNNQPVDGSYTATKPGTYLLADDPLLGAPIKLAAVLIIKEGPAAPAEPVTPGLHNFKKVNTYADGQYSDVPAGHTFAANVKAGYEYDIMQGYGAAFGVSGNITRLASIIVACRLNAIYYDGSNHIDKTYSGSTQERYLAYAKDNGILCDFDDISRNATRAEFAAILSSALPDEAIPAVNTVVDNAIPDVTSDTPYSSDIYRLYRAGILNGSDAAGTFYPASYITRGAACAIATRMCDEALRKSVDLSRDYPTRLSEDLSAVHEAYSSATNTLILCANKLKSINTSSNFEDNSKAYVHYQSAAESLRAASELCAGHSALKEVKALTDEAVGFLLSSLPVGCSMNSQTYFNGMYSGLQKALVPMQKASSLLAELMV